MTKSAFCLCLLFWGAPEIFSQNLTPHADSLLGEVQRLPDDTAKVRVIFDHALALDKSNLNDNLVFLQKGQKLAQQLGAADWLPEFDTQFGRNHANQARPDSALFYFAKARAGFEKMGNLRGQASVLSKIRWVHNYLGDHEKAQQFGIEALSIYEKLGDQPGIAAALGNLGDVLYSQNKYRESAGYFQKSYDLNKKLNRPEELAVAAQGLGFAYLQLGEHQKALDFQNEALRARRQLGGAMDIGISLNARGNALKYLKRYPEALADYQECVEAARKSGFSPLESVCASNIGHVYNLLGEFRKALPYHLAYRRVVEKTNRLDNAVENLLHLSEAYAGTGRFDSAYFFKKLQLELSDSLLNADNQKRMSELRTKYETAEKETQIAQQTEQLTRERARFGAVLAGLVLALAAGAALFRLTQKLRQRNREKEFLIKEIHHRVKNNLQVLSSLLYLQSRQIKDETALDAVREGQNRVDAMGLIHQKLYMGDRLAAVEMGEYLHELGDTLLDSFGLHDDRVKINSRLDPLRLDVDTAIPLGLIINELVTNSLKYAFPGGRAGAVDISLWKADDGKLCLKVADDGVGKDGVLEKRKSTSFGTGLVEMLSKKLKGRPEVEVGGTGYATVIRFEQFKEA